MAEGRVATRNLGQQVLNRISRRHFYYLLTFVLLAASLLYRYIYNRTARFTLPFLAGSARRPSQSGNKTVKVTVSAGDKPHTGSRKSSKADLRGITCSGKSEWATNYIARVHKSYILISSEAIRIHLTGSASDMSREEKVEATILHEIEKIIAKKRSCVIDDCIHNLNPHFRQKILALIPREGYNCVLKFFPIKLLFANARLTKDIEEGIKKYRPSQLELEDQLRMYTDTEKTMAEEGWITSDEVR